MSKTIYRAIRCNSIAHFFTLVFLAGVITLLTGMQRASSLPPALHPLRFPASHSKPVDQALVKLASGISPQVIEASANSALLANRGYMANNAAAQPIQVVRTNKALGWTTYRISNPAMLQQALASIRKIPGVLAAEPDYRILPCIAAPNDTYWNLVDLQHLIVVLSGLDTPSTARQDDTSYWTYTWNLQEVSAGKAWGVYPGSYPTAASRKLARQYHPAALPLIGVIDSGIDFTHPDFSYTGNPSHGTADTDVVNGGQIDRSLAADFINGYQGPYPALAKDDVGHGTSVSGIIAAAPNNKNGIPGLGFMAQIIPIKVIDANGNGNDSDLLDALQYAADNHCVAVNLSLDLDTTNYPQALQDAVNYCWNKGTLCIAAAGNDGNPSMPILAQTRRYPASCDHVLAVSATTYGATKDPNGNPNTVLPEQLASYSNDGYELGCAAPGGDITTFYNNSAGGQSLGLDPIQEYVLIWSLAPTYQVLLSNPDPANPDGLYAQLGLYGLNYGYLPGTSLACPHVVGVAAECASKYSITSASPNAPQTLVDMIERGCDKLNGRIDGGYDPTFGYGRIDEYASVLNQNRRNATVGGFIGQVTLSGTVLGNLQVSAKLTNGTGRTYYASTFPDGMYHIVNVPAGTYTARSSAFGFSTSVQVTVLPGCDQLGIDIPIIFGVVGGGNGGGGKGGGGGIGRGGSN